MRKIIIPILLLLFGLIAFRVVFNVVQSHNNKKGGQSAPAVTVMKVPTEDIIRSFEAPARVSAKYRVEVTARISGYLTKSYFKEGDYVKKGQLLFEIEPLEYKLAVQKAKGNLDNAKAQLDYYEKQLARYQDLVAKDYVAKSEYDNMLAQRDAFRAQVSLNEGAYNDAMRNYGYTQVKAPVDGRVGIINITFPLDSKDYVELVSIDGGSRVNRVVEYKFSTGMLYKEKGLQDFHDNKVDETTGTITLRATFKNPHGELIQGDYGRIMIFSNNKVATPVVPVEAVLENQEGQYVYKLDDENLPRLTYIKTSFQQDNKWIVKEGLKADDVIITTGLQKVVAGQPVKIVESPDLQKVEPKKKVSLTDKVKSLISKKNNNEKAA